MILSHEGKGPGRFRGGTEPTAETESDNRMKSKPKRVAVYSRSLIKAIKAAALKQYPTATSISHIRPRAYCIAKPAACCVVFVTPPDDAEPQLKGCQSTTAEVISDGDVSKIKVGDWCVLAYICTPGIGMTRVIKMS